MKRAFSTFLGVDLGGGRGKTTAVAELRMTGPQRVEVFEVATRAGTQPWTDVSLFERLVRPADAAIAGTAIAGTVIAIDAPLTATACNRCTRPVCPGVETCEEPAVVWLRTTGRALVRGVAAETANGTAVSRAPAAQARLAPYAHRATEVVMTYERGLLPLTTLGHATGAIAARASHLRKRLRGAGHELHRSLIEVSPAATIAALLGPRLARGYKRDADPWRTRATILEHLSDELGFAPQSRMAREDVLRNDHCFDAVIGAYTAYLWARDGWDAPATLEDDGWIFAP
nr:DUF429 domain-containing protein [Kofleriaceae bacterium]